MKILLTILVKQNRIFVVPSLKDEATFIEANQELKRMKNEILKISSMELYQNLPPVASSEV